MRTSPITREDLQGVFPVPPLARRRDPQRTLDFNASARIVDHLAAAGITRLLFGGNAFLYHLSLQEYEQLLEWLESLPDHLWCIPSAGPSYGRLMDQAPLLRRYGFPCVMVLPCNDPRDAGGLEKGLREFADAAGMPLTLYVKDELGFGADRAAGLDAVGRLVECGVCCAIKYAVVRKDPTQDDYLAGLLARVDGRRVVSGIGERPAVVHLLDWHLPGFTTGSGCIAPALSQALFAACERGDRAAAEALRASFLPLEDLRDAWGPAPVLHAAVEAAGIAATGPLPPFASNLSAERFESVKPVAQTLAAQSLSRATKA
ncbi:MAG: dihydrodipicolinate synthase family protein [Terriglobia bacterium]|jgi:dihydrodipicolinate synthase/N-acetylneuraminate lyase